MRRIGLVIPSSNVVVEDMLRRHAGQMDRTVAVHIARLSVVSVGLDSESTGQFGGEPVDRAIDQLREAGVERIVFAGTAGAWLGIPRERAWSTQAGERAGVGVTSTTLITIDALRGANARRPALVTPFTTDIHDRILEGLREEGIPMAAGRHLGMDVSRDMADVPPSVIAGLIRSCLDDGSDAVLCFCTNFRGLDAGAIVSADHRPAALFDSVGLTFQAFGAFDHS